MAPWLSNLCSLIGKKLMPKYIEGKLDATGLRFGVVVSRFNSFITEPLLAGAMDAFLRHGGKEKDITIVRVPGSFEIPLVAKTIAESGKVDAVVALGAIIRGSTSHYDLVCSEAAKGIAHAAVETSVPIAFGVVTTDTIEQAIERAGTKAGNKGFDAAVTAIEMANVMHQAKG
jgi:6,7-dimethyl-8-ribityllumazine synthase